MTVLRLEAVAGTAVDLSLSTLEAVTLVRRPDGRYADVVQFEVARMVRALAYAGIDAVPCASDLETPARTFPAIGCDLRPVPAAVMASDVVRVRRLSIGEATAELLRRRWWGLRAAPPTSRERCRAVLRGDDSLLAWTRRAWGTRAALRTPAARSSLRPVVFDRAAFDRADLRSRAFARDAALGRWLFG